MACQHWWCTVEEFGYGWVSICEDCGLRESAEHSPECFRLLDAQGCICGASEEFEEYEKEKQ